LIVELSVLNFSLKNIKTSTRSGVSSVDGGRVTRAVNLGSALFILGSLLAGVGSDLFGGPKMITIILAGTAAGICILIFMLSSTVRNYRLSEGIASNSARKPGESRT
jgi:MFS family permease